VTGCFGDQLGGYVVEKNLHRIKGVGKDVPGVGPPLTGCFARPRHHGIDEHDQVYGAAITDQGGREPGERLRNKDQFFPVSGGSKDGPGILMETRGVVIAGQVHGDGAVAQLLELWDHQVPQPRL